MASKVEPIIIGEYEVEREIARGGYGSVVRAKHSNTGALVAIKVLHTEQAGETSSVARFEREAAILFALAHPNLTRIHGWGRLADRRPYIVMELLEGESLDKRLAKTRRLSVEEALGILEPIAHGLEVAHARGIIHRDIKPANVFLAPSRSAGNVVLLDFGIAKLVAEAGQVLTTSRASLGTIPFMAPEQIRGESVDARSDVYALGALTYMMLTGSPPFGTQPTAVLRQIHLHTRPPRPSERAPMVSFFDAPILRAISAIPAERPASAREFVMLLRAHVANASPKSLSNGVFDRSALAVHAELRVDVKNDEHDEEALLEAMESSLRLVSAELRAIGLVLVQESSRRLLAVSPAPPDNALVREAHFACIRAYFGVVSTRLIDLAICVHCGILHTNESRTLLPSGLLDISTWVPAIGSGVVASHSALADHLADLEAVPGTRRFYWIERSQNDVSFVHCDNTVPPK